MAENEDMALAAGAAPGLRPCGAEPAAQSQAEPLVPSAECDGKRSFSSREWAERGLRAIEREHSHDSRRGRLHTYRCEDCHGWHIGRSFQRRRPKHRQQPEREVDEAALSRNARYFAEADAIAKERFPYGANASQFSQILREVLASGMSAGTAKTAQPVEGQRPASPAPLGETPQ